MIHNVTLYFSWEMIEIRERGKRRLYTGSASDTKETSQRTPSANETQEFQH